MFEARDAEAGFDWLRTRHAGRKVGIIGISLGGAAALLGDNGPLRADALILQAVYPNMRSAIRNRIQALAGPIIGYIGEPFLSFQAPLRFGRWPSRISPLEAVTAFKGKLLVIGGGADAYTPPPETKALFDQAQGQKSLWIVDGADHVEASDLSTAEYRTRVRSFLKSALEVEQGPSRAIN